MKKEIVSIEGHSAAKVVGVTYLFIGLVFGLLAAVVAFLAEGFTTALILPVLLMPVLYGVLGYLAAWLGALLYNVAAKYVGGIVLTVRSKDETTTS